MQHRPVPNRLAVALAAAFFFAILTLWVPAYWPVALFETVVFMLAAVTAIGWRNQPLRFSYPLLPLSFAVAWGLFQWATGRTVYAFETKNAITYWTTALAVFLTGVGLFRDQAIRRWFRTAMLWFGFAVSVEALLQDFTSGGKIFWIFSSGSAERLMGPFLYRNHYAVFVEVVLPIALYQAFRAGSGSLLYAVISATLYASVVASAWGLGVAAVFAHAAVDYPFSRPALACWPLLLIAMLAARGRDHDN